MKAESKHVLAFLGHHLLKAQAVIIIFFNASSLGLKDITISPGDIVLDSNINAGGHILRNWLVTKAVRSDSLGYVFYWKAPEAIQKKSTKCTRFHSTLN